LTRYHHQLTPEQAAKGREAGYASHRARLAQYREIMHWNISVAEAARRIGVTTRTIYRYRKELSDG
jgi:hypothetical protein